MVYATVNMEYADFFYGELNNIAAGNETTPDLSNDKVASYRETGMYDAVTSATNKKSIKYATSYYKTGVANDEDETKGSDGTISNTTLYGIKEVKIAIPKALYDNLYEQKDDSANKNSKIYEYLNNAEYSDEAFNSEYKVLNADGTFSKMITTEGTVEDKDAEPVLTTSTTWGDYQIDIANLGVGDTTATTTNMYGIILTDENGEVTISYLESRTSPYFITAEKLTESTNGSITAISAAYANITVVPANSQSGEYISKIKLQLEKNTVPEPSVPLIQGSS